MTRTMRISRSISGAAAALLALTCTRTDKPRAPANSLGASNAPLPPTDTITIPPHLACYSPDSGALVYGQVTASLETSDVSGVSFSFVTTPVGMIGTVVDARGEEPPPKRLQALHYSKTSDSLSFWYQSTTGTRYIYSLRPSCDSLWGTGRLFVTANDSGQIEAQTFHRNR